SAPNLRRTAHPVNAVRSLASSRSASAPLSLNLLAITLQPGTPPDALSASTVIVCAHFMGRKVALKVSAVASHWALLSCIGIHFLPPLGPRIFACTYFLFTL